MQEPDSAHARAELARLHYAPAESRALGTFALVAAFAVACVVVPVGSGVLLGALLAFTAHGLNRSLIRRTRKPVVVALTVTVGTTFVVAATLGILVYVVILQGVTVGRALPQAFASGGPATKLVEHLAAPLALLKLNPTTLVDKVRDAAGGLADSLPGWVASVVGTLMEGALALFFMATTMYVVLRHWAELSKRAEYLLPLNPRHTQRLMRDLRRIGRTVIIGNLGTGLVQGVLAGLGYWVARIPEPAFFGAMTAVASLIPAFGTMLIWLPAGLVLLAGGHSGAGSFELVWAVFAVVGVSDYVVRPKLVGRGETMSTWMTFVALFGGIKLFGFIGLLLGPLLVGVSMSVLTLYQRVRRFRLGLA